MCTYRTLPHMHVLVLRIRCDRCCVQSFRKLSTAIIQRGTLRKGSILTAGLAWCRVKKLLNDKSLEILEAPPSMPVEIVGWHDLPSPGDVLIQVETEVRVGNLYFVFVS